MKKTTQIAAVILMASAMSSAHADSIRPFANSLLGKSERQAGAVSNDKPDVDKSLALFASSILH